MKKSSIFPKEESIFNIILPYFISVGLAIIYLGIYRWNSHDNMFASDWKQAFKPGALGDLSLVVTPFWSLFVSWIPARLPNDLGFFVWTLGGLWIFIWAIKQFDAPWWIALLSLQVNRNLIFGQIDLYVVAGLGIGYWALKKKTPFVTGLAILLLLIKPQIGWGAALVFFLLEKNKRVLLITIFSVVLLSLVIAPTWPIDWIQAITTGFIDRPENAGVNISPVPIFSIITLMLIAFGVVIIVFLYSSNFLNMEVEKSLKLATVLSILSAPYSPFYSTVIFWSFKYPRWISIVFIIAPWVWAFVYNIAQGWQWMIVFPIVVFLSIFFYGERNSESVI